MNLLKESNRESNQHWVFLYFLSLLVFGEYTLIKKLMGSRARAILMCFHETLRNFLDGVIGVEIVERLY